MKKIDVKGAYELMKGIMADAGDFLEGDINDESAKVEEELGKYKKADANDLENKSNQIKNTETKKEQKDIPTGPDLYLDKSETMYHNVQKMNSLAVLQKEKEVCDEIIEYKKIRGADYEVWETKKEDIDDRISSIKSFLEDGSWDSDKYKNEIMNQYKWESKLLLFADKEQNLNEEQRKVLKERIEERKKIIDDEI